MYEFQSSWRTELVFLSLISHIIIVLLMKFLACMWRNHVLNPKLKGTPKFLYLSGYFPAAMLMSHGGSSTWRPHTGFCNFVQNILMNIWSLVKHTNWKLGKVSSLWISYNITISWFSNDFLHCIRIAWQCKPRIHVHLFLPPYPSCGRWLGSTLTP